MPSSLDLRRIEELGLNSSAPPGQLLYDGWLLRLLPGQAKRARSVNAVYPSTRQLAEKVPYCERIYRSHKLPVIFRITPFSEPAGLDAELERRGYPKFDQTMVEDGWAGLFDIVTDKALRRQGYGQQLIHGLLQAAWELGARHAYLQVTADNTPARTLYARLGFTQRYQYWYRGHPE